MDLLVLDYVDGNMCESACESLKSTQTAFGGPAGACDQKFTRARNPPRICPSGWPTYSSDNQVRP